MLPRPPRRRPPSLVLIVAALLLPAAAIAETPPSAPAELKGIARDPGGQGLQKVEVVVARLFAPDRPARAVTDDQGRFLVRGLVPGLYKVTAAKNGYDVATLRVNTLVRKTLDVVLRPAGSPPPPGERPESLDWVLRLRNRDLLEKRDADALLREALSSEEAGARATVDWRPEVSGAVEQWYWAGTPFGDGEMSDERGLVTSLEIASPLTPVSWMRVKGLRFQEDTAVPAGGDGVSEFLRHRVDLETSWVPTSRDDVQMSAYFDRGLRDLPLPVDSVADEFSRGDESAWGYEARWNTLPSRRSSLDLSLAYHESRLDLEGDGAAAVYGTEAQELAGRSVAAAITFGAHLGAGHELRVAADARHHAADATGLQLVPAYGEGAAVAAFPAADWDLGFSISDAWRVARLVTLSYGVDYRRALLDDPVALVVPHAGVTLAPAEHTRLVGSLSWTARDGGWSTMTPNGELERFGYRLGLEQGLGARNVLTLSTERRPAGHGLPGGPAALIRPEGTVLYLGDGGVDARWWGADWTIRFRGGSTTLGFERGRADGQVAPRLPGDLPVVRLQSGEVAFSVSRAEMRWDPSGTLVQVRLESVDAPGAWGGIPESYERVSVTVDQELPFLKIRDTRWRFLLAIQDNLGEAPPTDGDSDGTSARPALLTAHRISGGIAVSF